MVFNEKLYISAYDSNCRIVLCESIKEYIQKKRNKHNSIAVFCIGTDRATGDSLGPLVGTRLVRMGMKNVMGTIDTPVHAVNIDEKIKLLYERFDKPLVLAIDACLGIYSHIGSLSIWEGAISPGAGISKKLSEIGDISITGIVNKWSHNGIMQLQSTRLSVVMNMSEIIADSIFYALQNENVCEKNCAMVSENL
ncbi:MAG: spore protease YyaC [Clostridia bacterium]|nr:spore protease YyaC [Clostridia bacterium]